MHPELASSLAQFGTAGLIGWMWLTERRAAAHRERQLSEAHDRLLQERRALDMVVAALNDNTRVLSALEAGQRMLASVLERTGRSSHERDSSAAA